MCDHHRGYAGTGSNGRRAFLRSGVAGAIAISVPLGILGGARPGKAA
jgi:hypothetical protein